ncbi:hypothetical protein SLS57_005543 [Botryosphaeria dothidea]
MVRLARLACLAAASPLVFAAFKEGCADAPWDSSTDFWLNKFEAVDDLPFVPNYNNTYVAIQNRQRRYVVLHCSNERPPTSVVGEDALFVKVPVQNVAALDGFSQNLIDMLGMSHTVARVGEYSTITSACYRGLQYQNETYDEIKWDEAPAVNVTFHADVTDTDTQKVLLHRNGMNAPLASAAYIKFMSMFYGLEELAETLYNNIAKDYRCVAAGVQDLAMQDKYPSGAYISVINDLGNGSEVFASQSTWWKILANDAGSALLNISTTGNASDAFSPSGEGVTLDINRASKITNEAWAIIDTTWYDYLQGQTAASRVDTTNYARLSGASSAIYAIKKHNVFLTDKEENWNLRHNFFDLAPARPDLVLRDIVAAIAPAFDPDHAAKFVRSIERPHDERFQRAYAAECVDAGDEVGRLNVTRCALPRWAAGYRRAGVAENAYGREEGVESLALAGGGGLTGGQKAGISLGAVIGGLAVVAGVVALVCRWEKKMEGEGEEAVGGDVEKGVVGKGSAGTSVSS